ncbi:MAG: hypothetical protein GEV03_04275 [Streptosporangiales bacterium]|nr:hypothetical protein [Streptosporangiales bacterium]
MEDARRRLDSGAGLVDPPGWLVRFELRYPRAEREGWNFTRDAVAFAVVDRGAGQRPGFLYVAIPNSHKNHGDLDLLLDSLRAL